MTRFIGEFHAEVTLLDGRSFHANLSDVEGRVTPGYLPYPPGDAIAEIQQVVDQFMDAAWAFLDPDEDSVE